MFHCSKYILKALAKNTSEFRTLKIRLVLHAPLPLPPLPPLPPVSLHSLRGPCCYHVAVAVGWTDTSSRPLQRPARKVKCDSHPKFR